MTFARFQKILVLFLLTASGFFGGWYFGKSGYIFEVRKNPPEIKILNRTPPRQSVDFDLFWEVWEIVRTQYLERPVDAKKMMYGALVGMVQSLGDPYTSFLPPVQNETVTNAINGVYEGIGAELGMRENQLIVVSPLDGSPAKAAGVLPGDAILEIEGRSTVGIALSEAVSMIRGESETTVSLTLARRGADKPFKLSVKRGQVTVPSIVWEDKGDGVAYIRLSRFGSETNAEWSKVASEVNVNMKELDAVVLDVRGNPGGYMQAAVFIAGEFFSGKPVMYEETSVGEQIPFETNRAGNFNKLPVFVLIDGGSASASEILAGALKADAGAVLVGSKSFGKGTIQDARDFDDGSGLHITIAKWLTPDKKWVHNVGLTPDVVVESNLGDDGKTDAQLEKALELARGI